MTQDAPEKAPSWRAYLLLSKGHVVPIDSLEPAALKAGVSQVQRNPDAQEDGHATLLNATLKMLGFRGGNPGYLREGYPQLQRFLAQQGLKRREDLLTPRRAYMTPHGNLYRRSLADRLFNSELPLPQRVFTGYDFDWHRLDQFDHQEDDHKIRELLWSQEAGGARDGSEDVWRRAENDPWLL